MNPKEKKNLAVFSYGLPLIVCAFVLLHVRKHGWMVTSYLLLTAALISIFITMLRPTWLKPFYDQWMRVAYIIGSIVTAVCLCLIFYFIFAPIGILLRLLRKDFLDRSVDKTAMSYWLKSENTSADRKRDTQQF